MAKAKTAKKKWGARAAHDGSKKTATKTKTKTRVVEADDDDAVVERESVSDRGTKVHSRRHEDEQTEDIAEMKERSRKEAQRARKRALETKEERVEEGEGRLATVSLPGVPPRTYMVEEDADDDDVFKLYKREMGIVRTDHDPHVTYAYGSVPATAKRAEDLDQEDVLEDTDLPRNRAAMTMEEEAAGDEPENIRALSLNVEDEEDEDEEDEEDEEEDEEDEDEEE